MRRVPASQKARSLGRKALAALGAATLEHQAAGLGRHPLAEAVAAGALQVTGLECPFHGNLLWSNLVSAGKINEEDRQCQEKQAVIHSP